VEVVGSENLIQHFEARWSAEQLESHLEAGRRVDKVREEAFKLIGDKLRAGEPITEYDVLLFVQRRFKESGLFADHGPIAAVNANASNQHYEPKPDKHQAIHAGDLVLLDMWAKLDQPDSVYYDITWTGFCGAAPPAEMENIFTIVKGARDAAIARVKLAVDKKQTLHGFEVDDAARGYIASHGYGEWFVHRTGHSIGTEVHGTGANMDNLETHDERRVVPRTCFSIEPGIYLAEFGIRSEVNMYIGDDSARVTGAMQDRMVSIL
jgi:Xaa-Pro dipeptidase